jgi:sialic acid synthase SpsE
LLIAEIGNNALGSMTRAKELIRAANDSGADLVKGQAFLAKDVAKTGSMPLSFYKECEMNFDQYVSLIDYSRSLGIDMFYSIFSKPFEALNFHQYWFKVAGIQTKNQFYSLKFKDTPRTIVSVPENCVTPKLKHAQILHVSPYLADNPQLELINHLTMVYKRSVGYSDHTIGIDWCLKALRDYNIPILEKHFNVGPQIKWEGQTFRDTVHSATPKQFEKLRRTYEKIYKGV